MHFSRQACRKHISAPKTMPYSLLQLQAWQADSKFPYTFKLYGNLQGAGTDDGQKFRAIRRNHPYKLSAPYTAHAPGRKGKRSYIQVQTKHAHICFNHYKWRLGTFSHSFIPADLKDKYVQFPRHSKNIKGAEPLKGNSLAAANCINLLPCELHPKLWQTLLSTVKVGSGPPQIALQSCLLRARVPPTA